ncbi:MAG: type II secretion system GspH family protein [Clostridia bacterium]|nr:type II secretion system GspH family protein [Clostridia bacterium]
MKNKSSKKGFTLLEVMLAIAIMVVASTMIMEGFLSTLAYSANTALYARQGGYNQKQMYQAVAEKIGKNGDAGAKSLTDPNSKTFSSTTGEMEMTGSLGTVKYRVNTWKSSYTLTNTVDGEAGADSNTSYNRYAVTYCLPDIKCPTCGKTDHLAISAKTYKWMCTKCSVYVGETSSS